MGVKGQGHCVHTAMIRTAVIRTPITTVVCTARGSRCCDKIPREEEELILD